MLKTILEPAKGGNAHAEGDYSYAEGGAAGDSSRGVGGDGGHAHALGKYSIAVGGRGGRGGVGKGSPGGNAVELSEDAACYGGNGGESGQHDGRGGRGGTPQMLQVLFGAELARRAEMKLPYGSASTCPGRGGDGCDTPQYMARRLIVEQIKYRYFVEHDLPTEGTFSSSGRLSGWSDVTYQTLTEKNCDVWFDRTIVPLAWINDQIQQRGNKWIANIEDNEYVFTDRAVI